MYFCVELVSGDRQCFPIPEVYWPYPVDPNPPDPPYFLDLSIIAGIQKLTESVRSKTAAQALVDGVQAAVKDIQAGLPPGMDVRLDATEF